MPSQISIHALLAESDMISMLNSPHSKDFYPRSPCGERRYTTRSFGQSTPKFLSTLSLRRATISCAWSASKLGDFYPRSPCGERQLVKLVSNSNITTFLSTLSLRRATAFSFAFLYSTTISIHALLAESDRQRETSVIFAFNFYPRSPCGERQE